MRIAEVIGNVTLSRWHPLLSGSSWKVVVPFNQSGLRDRTQGRGEPFVAFDELGSGEGSLIAISEGAEAAAAFHPEVKPVDAYNAAILDHIEIE